VRLNGGILGRVASVEDQIVLVEIADKVRIRVLKRRDRRQVGPARRHRPAVIDKDGAEARS
jgi:preprotein translocase subunit YajC